MGCLPLPIRHRKCQSKAGSVSLNLERRRQMKVTTVGLDLAKNVIQVHGVDGRGWLVVTNVCASAFDKRGGTSKPPRLVSVHSLCLRIRSGTPRPSCGPAVRTTACVAGVRQENNPRPSSTAFHDLCKGHSVICLDSTPGFEPW